MNTPTLPELVKDLCQILSLKESMLAALVGVTEASLLSAKKNMAYNRLSALHYLAHACIDDGIPQDEILNVLDNAFEPTRDDSMCLLTFITTDKVIPLSMFTKQLKEFKKSL